MKSKQVWGMCSVAMLVWTGCMAPPAEGVGELSMPLVSVGQSGTTYRLRDARFVIRNAVGEEVAALDGGGTEDELRQELLTGEYTATLEGAWRLRDEDAGAVVDAVLVNNPTQSVSVIAGEITDVVYRFSLAEDAVSFGRGRADIRIEVEEPYTTVEQPVATTCWGLDAVNPNHRSGQSFIAPVTGVIQRLEMPLQASEETLLSIAIFDGEGLGGVLLHTQVVDPSYGSGSVTPFESYVMTTPVPVVAGQSYTIGLGIVPGTGQIGPFGSLVSYGGHCGTLEDLYEGGTPYFNLASYAEADSAFRVVVAH